MSDDPAFTLRDVTVTYGDLDACSGVDLDIARGELVGLVGPSGSGKTTVLRAMAGANRPTRGTVAVLEQPLADLRGRSLRSLRSRIGFIHQDLALVPNLPVLQNVLAGGLGGLGPVGTTRALIWPRRADVRRAHELLEQVGIPEKLYERLDRLSGGQKQRVAIARALFQEPDAILADEPISSVDPARARDTLELLTRLCRETGRTLCVSLHNLELAHELLPRLVGMRAGEVVFDRPSKELQPEDFTHLYELEAGSEIA